MKRHSGKNIFEHQAETEAIDEIRDAHRVEITQKMCRLEEGKQCHGTRGHCGVLYCEEV